MTNMEPFSREEMRLAMAENQSDQPWTEVECCDTWVSVWHDRWNACPVCGTWFCMDDEVFGRLAERDPSDKPEG